MSPHQLAWDDLKVFLAVVRAGSFRAAAKALRVEQSTVSRRIATLESSFGLLFDRMAGGPVATERALALVPHAQRMEREWILLVEQSQREDSISGRVRVGAPSSFALQVLVPYILPVVRKLYPRLRVDLIVDERASDIETRDVEIALRFFRPVHGNLVARRVADMTITVLARADYLEGRTHTVEALDWIALDLGPTPTLETALFARHPSVEPTMKTNLHAAQIEAVRAGLGVALLPRVLCQLMPDLTELKLPKVSKLLPTVELWLVAPRSLAKEPRIRALLTLFGKMLLGIDNNDVMARLRSGANT